MTELKDILHKINALGDMPEPYLLKKLVDNLRVSSVDYKKNSDSANKKIQQLITLLQEYPQYANGLAVFVLTLLNKYHRMSLYTDTGIFSDQNFTTSLMRLFGHRIVPLLPDNDSIVELVAYVFDDKNDEKWLASVDGKLWDQLVDILAIDEGHSNLVATAKNNILNAMVILSYRISGIGLHPDLMRAYPELLDYSAAFVAQNQEAVLFANEYRDMHQLDKYQDVMPRQDIDPAPLLVMLEQCDNIVNTVRKRIYKTGISIRLTNMLLRLEQSIKRLRILSELLANNLKNRDKAMIELAEAIIVSVKRRYSISYLINNNTKLLSRKITENSGRVGEHYISTDKSGYKQMFKKAAIGGFIIAFMATIKILSYDLELAPMGRAFVNSMIYGLGFVFIHIIHGTVATKQPAMTAAAIASTISDGSGKKSHQLVKLSELMVDIIRTQFIAIMGNVMIAMPLALAISFIWMQYFSTPMITDVKAHHLLHDLDPFHSLALFHAAIAGVYLFLAGLIAGYYDNLALFNNIGERISKHKYLLKILPQLWVERLGVFVENNLGAIMSNFLFGVFLGSTATVGYIFGLPLDIRHIAFASANFAHGLFNIPAADFTYSLVFLSLLGVALIGIINLLVSFFLAMIVAMRSKSVQLPEWKIISKLVFNHLITQPRDFFLPRPEPMKYAKINSSGQMIYEDIKKAQKNKLLPKHFAVRRLSNIKVTQKGVTIETSQADTKQTNIINSTVNQANANVTNTSATNASNNQTSNLTTDVASKHKNSETYNANDQANNDIKATKTFLVLEDLIFKLVPTQDHIMLKSDDSQSLQRQHSQQQHSATTNSQERTSNKDVTSGHNDSYNKTANAKTPLPKPKNPPKLPE